MTKPHRQIQRTRNLLEKALIELIKERGYETITIQQIVDRANAGRTTFYLHYNSKDELFLSCHNAIVSEFQFGPLYPLSREELLSPEAPARMMLAYRHLDDARASLYPIFQGSDSLLMLRRMLHDWTAHQIGVTLRAAFPDSESRHPIDLVANYLAGAHLTLLQWWLEKRQLHTPEVLAQTFHGLQRAAIRETFLINEVEY